MGNPVIKSPLCHFFRSLCGTTIEVQRAEQNKIYLSLPKNTQNFDLTKYIHKPNTLTTMKSLMHFNIVANEKQEQINVSDQCYQSCVLTFYKILLSLKAG